MHHLQFPSPQAVFRHFCAIAAIPHGSGNTAAIRAYCRETADSLGLSAKEDAAGNLIIRKPASKGAEKAPAVILQGHLDMVCAQLPECTKDMQTEGLDLRMEGDFLFAEGTTLGGDDGIAIAYALAILESDTIVHPPLTVLLTNDEEIGLLGAGGLAEGEVEGAYLLNLDSEKEGEFIVGCAGGARVDMTFSFRREMVSGVRATLSLTGLSGGHSGTEIHRPLLNANCGMAKLLSSIAVPMHLCTWQGGTRDNVITADATASVLLAPQDQAQVMAALQTCEQSLRQQYPEETQLHLAIAWEQDVTCSALTAESTAVVLEHLCSLPQGVTCWHETLHMPKTSLNLGIVELTETSLLAVCSVRSLSDSERDALAETLCRAAQSHGGTARCHAAYPAWDYVPDSKLEQIACNAFTACYGTKPQVLTIHAGLECGVICAKCSGLEAISFGPDLYDIHSPRERLSIASTVRTWKLLLRMLSDIAAISDGQA